MSASFRRRREKRKMLRSSSRRQSVSIMKLSINLIIAHRIVISRSERCRHTHPVCASSQRSVSCSTHWRVTVTAAPSWPVMPSRFGNTSSCTPTLTRSHQCHEPCPSTPCTATSSLLAQSEKSSSPPSTALPRPGFQAHRHVELVATQHVHRTR